MFLAFEDEKVRAMCEQSDAAREALGEDAARALRARLSEVEVASGIADLPAALWQINRSTGQVVGWLGTSQSIFLVANNNPRRLTKSETSDWDHVSRLRVVSIGPSYV